MNSSDYRKEARNRLAGKWGKVAIITLIYMFIFFVFGFIEGLLGQKSPVSSLLSLIQAIIQVPLSFGLIMALLKAYRNENVESFDFLSFGFNNFKRAWGVAWHVFLKLIVPIILMIIIVIVFTVSIVINKAYFLASTARVSSQQFSSSSSSLFNDLPSSSYEDDSLISLYSKVFSSGITLICAIAILAVNIWLICKSFYYSLAYIIAADEPDLTTKDAVEKSKELMTGKRGKLFILQLSFIGWMFLLGLVAGVFSLLESNVLPTIVTTIGLLFLVPYVNFATFSFYENLQTSKPIETEVDKPQEDDPIQEN